MFHPFAYRRDRNRGRSGGLLLGLLHLGLLGLHASLMAGVAESRTSWVIRKRLWKMSEGDEQQSGIGGVAIMDARNRRVSIKKAR